MEKTNYKELDWVERLMYCFKNKLPESIALTLGKDFASNFQGLQELLSSNELASFYYIRVVPDFIFKTGARWPAAGVRLVS